MGKENNPAQPPQRRPKMVLPFEKRKRDFGSWAYEHRVGMCCMVMGYLALGILFVSAKIVIAQRTTYNTLYLDLTQMMAEIPPQEQELPDAQDDDLRHVRNRISDENGGRESVGSREAAAASEQTAKTLSDWMEGLDEEAEAVANRVEASRKAYEKGNREIQEMVDRHRAQREAREGEKPSGVKEKGKVLISYHLPGRVEAGLHLPAYQCDGGGEVTVSITVNRNGKVVSASLKESSSSRCINETAVMAARNSRFNVDGEASDRQTGTITYIFVPQ